MHAYEKSKFSQYAQSQLPRWHPSLEERLLPCVNERERHEHPVLIVTNAEKMAAAAAAVLAEQSSLWLIVSPLIIYGF